MRTVLVFLIALTAEAFAHGGRFRGPNGGVPPGLRSLSCDCARVDCAQCSAKDLFAGTRLAGRAVRFERFQRWNDFAVVRCTASFRSKEGKRPIEAFAALAPGALFAPLGGSIVESGQTLPAARVTSREARRKYLWSKMHGLDPFLLMREGPGRYALRVFPVRDSGDTVVTIEGIALAPARTRGAPRVYRTGDLVVVVRDLAAGEKPRGGEFHDIEGRRALRVAAAADVSGLVTAIDVAFAPDLKRAVHGDDTVLVALPPDAAMPPENAAATPPGNREPVEPVEPVDPVPPPPPSDPASP